MDFPTECARCNCVLRIHSVSRFNTDALCMECLDDEKQAPGYKAAQDAEFAAVQRGDYNFPGVGLSTEDAAFLAARRASRGAK